MPGWRDEAKDRVAPYSEGLDLLGRALEFAFERLETVKISSDEFAGSGGRALLPVLAARAIGTCDAIHALLEVAAIEQGEMLVRTLVDLQADAFALTTDDDAIGYYADWAIVEQARTALILRPEESSHPERDLEDRRKELSRELASRLREMDREAAKSLAEKPLAEALPGFCKIRYGSTWPPSWRKGYLKATGLKANDLQKRIIDRNIKLLGGDEVPDEVRQEFETNLERELETLFGHLSGEIHNSPLTMDGLIDPGSWTIKVHADISGLPRTLSAAFQHLMRITVLFEDEWGPGPPLKEWSELARALASWLERSE